MLLDISWPYVQEMCSVGVLTLTLIPHSELQKDKPTRYFFTGVTSMNPPRPSVDDEDPHITVGHISATASGGSFIVNNVPSTPQTIIYKPCKITDLEADAQGNAVVLSWTAPGGDLDQGQGKSICTTMFYKTYTSKQVISQVLLITHSLMF